MKTAMKKMTALVLIAVLALSMLTACGTQKIKMSDYVTVTFSGENKNGYASVRFDTLGFERDVMSGWKDKDNTWEKLAALTALEMSVRCDLSRTTGLRNGDKVTVTITFNEAAAKALGVKLTGLSLTCKVSGLS